MRKGDNRGQVGGQLESSEVGIKGSGTIKAAQAVSLSRVVTQFLASRKAGKPGRPKRSFLTTLGVNPRTAAISVTPEIKTDLSDDILNIYQTARYNAKGWCSDFCLIALNSSAFI